MHISPSRLIRKHRCENRNMKLTEDAEGHEEQQQVEREFGHGRTRGSTRAQNSQQQTKISAAAVAAAVPRRRAVVITVQTARVVLAAPSSII
jgi:hypothetical protein